MVLNNSSIISAVNYLFQPHYRGVDLNGFCLLLALYLLEIVLIENIMMVSGANRLNKITDSKYLA